MAAQKLIFAFLFFTSVVSVGNIRQDTTKPIPQASFPHDQQKLYDEAKGFLIQSKSDLALEKLFELLKMVEPGSAKADRIKLSIAEGYRQRREYQKGKNLLYTIIQKQGVNIEILAGAYGRMAAFYHEDTSIGNAARFDSAITYSNRCINISEKHGLTSHLAGSQNQLGALYLDMDADIDQAIQLLRSAIDNFLKNEKFPHASNAAINLSRAYQKKGMFEKAIEVIDTAFNYCNEQENIYLFRRMYDQKSKVYKSTGNFEQALICNEKCADLFDGFYKDRINSQISEMAAKYETEKLKKDNEIQLLKIQHKNIAIRYLTAGMFLFVILLVLIFYFYQKRNIAYKNLVNKNLELSHCDREILTTGQFIPTFIPGQEKQFAIIEKFNKYLSDEKPYLYSNITIDEVCAHIGTNRTYLSNAINTVYNKNFATIINEFRIRAARQIILDKSQENLTLDAIAKMVGYNSRTVFISNFKKITGITPSFFRESIEKKSV